MQVKANLSDIIEALEMQSEESRHFLNVGSFLKLFLEIK